MTCEVIPGPQPSSVGVVKRGQKGRVKQVVAAKPILRLKTRESHSPQDGLKSGPLAATVGLPGRRGLHRARGARSATAPRSWWHGTTQQGLTGRGSLAA